MTPYIVSAVLTLWTGCFAIIGINLWRAHQNRKATRHYQDSIAYNRMAHQQHPSNHDSYLNLRHRADEAIAKGDAQKLYDSWPRWLSDKGGQ